MKKISRILSRQDKILLSISWSLKFVFLLAFVISVIKSDAARAGLSILILIISFLPSMIKKKFKIISPPEFELVIALFLFAAIILGEMNGFYVRFHWWDIMLHAISGIVIAMVGFMIVFSLFYTHRVVFSPFVAALFVFSLGLSIGAMWEVFEFAMDSLFGWNMLKSGIVDTMWDLIIDGGAALLVAISGYFYLKGGPGFFMERFVKKFIRLNKHHMESKDLI